MEGKGWLPRLLLYPAVAMIRTVLLNMTYLLASLYRLTGYSSVDRHWLDDRHVVYFDDEGMHGPVVTGLFTIWDRPAWPVVGRAIVVGDVGKEGIRPLPCPWKWLLNAFEASTLPSRPSGFRSILFRLENWGGAQSFMPFASAGYCRGWIALPSQLLAINSTG